MFVRNTNKMFALNENTFIFVAFKLIIFIGVATCHQSSHRGFGTQSNELAPIKRYLNGLPMRYPNPYSPQFPDRFLSRYPWRYSKNKLNHRKGRRSDRFLEVSRQIDPRNDFEMMYRRHLQRNIQNFASKKKQLTDYKKTEEPIDIRGVTLAKDRFKKPDEPEGKAETPEKEEEPEYEESGEGEEKEHDAEQEPKEEYENAEKPATAEKESKKKPIRKSPVQVEEQEERQTPAKDPRPKPSRPEKGKSSNGDSSPKIEGLDDPEAPMTPEMPKSVFGSKYTSPDSYFPKQNKKKSPWSFSSVDYSRENPLKRRPSKGRPSKGKPSKVRPQEEKVLKDPPNNDWN